MIVSGTEPFRVLLRSGELGAIQILVIQPTFDEVIGYATGVIGYNKFILDGIKANHGTPVYTINAEVEGIALHNMFLELLVMSTTENIYFNPLQELLMDTNYYL